MSKIIKLGFKAKIKLLVKYFLIFIIVPIIGTLLHELGHYFVAISNGYEARIAYAYTSSNIPHDHTTALYFYYILGGPISTWMQSLLAFLIMLFYYNKERRTQINQDLPNFYIVLLSFTAICGRFIFNAGGYMFTHSESLDESKMATYLGIYPDLFVYGFAFAAWTILLVSISMIPRHLRGSIVLGALLGAVGGYLVWYYVIGPIILPVTTN